MDNENLLETKLDHKTLHFLPFLPSRTRRKKFTLKGVWGKTQFIVKAPETVNSYDLITLMFVTKAYLKKNWHAGYIEEEKKKIAGLELDLEQTCRERGILNKKVNRETILMSLMRLSHVDLFFTVDKETTMTKYIYEIKYDLDYKKVKIYANKRFVQFISNKGILLNLNNFVKLEQSKSSGKEYATLLYAFLAGTKTKINWKGKSILKWREKYTEEMLFNAIKLNETNMTITDKRKALKKAFGLLHTELKLPQYIYNKLQMWVRTDLIQNRNNKIK